jgi:ABC-type branched-subunit amino acid transport system ATPase component
MSPTILAIDGLSKNFGGVRAVQSVSLEIPAGRIFSVIGPNGAGKTTLINVLTGILASSGGKVTFDGEDITDAPAHLVAAAGMVRTFQNGRLFQRLTVIENVLVGAHHLLPQSVWSAILGAAATRRMHEIRARARALLATLGLTDDAERLVGALPYGRQRMVEIAGAHSGVGRAQYGPSHARRRPHRRDQFRREDRRGQPRGGPRRSQGARSLSRPWIPAC